VVEYAEFHGIVIENGMRFTGESTGRRGVSMTKGKPGFS
jgi:hypothetical protein